MNEIKEYTNKVFEDIKHIDEFGNEYTANSVHYEVGKELRSSIKRLSGTMPEYLQTPDRSLKELEKEERNNIELYNKNNN